MCREGEPSRRASGLEPGPAHPSQIIVGYAGSPILGGALSSRGYEEAASSLEVGADDAEQQVNRTIPSIV